MSFKLSAMLSILILATGLNAQETAPPSLKFSGFVRSDFFYDTRQTSPASGIREGLFYHFPDDRLLDETGKDVNASPSFHMLGIMSRLRTDITGMDIFGAKTSAAIEAEFFGTSESDLNGFRLRHGYVRLDWAKTSLLAGQFFHPAFLPDNFPSTVNVNAGSPFNPFGRNPQVKLTRKAGKAAISLTAYSERDFTSSGPDGFSNKYIRNSGMPALHLNMRIPVTDRFTVTAGGDYKVLRPELKTAANYRNTSTVAGTALYLNLKLTTRFLNLSTAAIYAKNACGMVMTGGYAVSSFDSITLVKQYTPLALMSGWIDLSTKGEKAVVGLFAGYNKNLGSDDPIAEAIYGRGTSLDDLLRISPRFVFTAGKFMAGAEVEITQAAYGSIRTDGRVDHTHPVTNTRVVLITQYKF